MNELSGKGGKDVKTACANKNGGNLIIVVLELLDLGEKLPKLEIVFLLNGGVLGVSAFLLEVTEEFVVLPPHQVDLVNRIAQISSEVARVLAFRCVLNQLSGLGEIFHETLHSGVDTDRESARCDAKHDPLERTALKGTLRITSFGVLN